jgi:hypothetical protein
MMTESALTPGLLPYRVLRGEGGPVTVLAKCDTEQPRAKQGKTGNGHSEKTVRGEFFTHGTPRLIVRPA